MQFLVLFSYSKITSRQVNINVIFTLEQVVKAQRGNRRVALLFLYPRRQMLVGGLCHVPTALRLDKRFGAHCTGGWMGSKASLEGCGKSGLHWHSIPEPSRSQRVAIPSTLSQTIPSQVIRTNYAEDKLMENNGLMNCARRIQKSRLFEEIPKDEMKVKSNGDICLTVHR